MTERLDLTLALLAERRKLAELRALLERVEQNRLEDDDRAMLVAVVSEVIEQAEPGQEWVTIEVSAEEAALVRQTGGAVGAADSTSAEPRQ
jgi:flagellar biosynthesis/type III secretory pathway protein FliH